MNEHAGRATRAPSFLLTLALQLALVAGACAAIATGAQAAGSPGPAFPALAGIRDHGHGHWFRDVCTSPDLRAASCQASVVSNEDGTPLASTTPPSSAYGPTQFHTAYNLPTTSVSGTPTIAIVDAYDDPNIELDLAAYDAQYGLPACTTANGCFRKVNQTGGTSYPSGTSWHLEIALDVETAHEICQNCKLILVEATSSSLANLGAAVNEAVALGANVVSNSYGGGEYSSETSDETRYYKHPGVAITASTGDSGYGVEFPAASQYVTAVGGTTLTLNGNGTRSSETVWSGSGSGCSAYVAKPSWQKDTGCTRRTAADVSADADPNTGAAVYDSIGASGGKAWYQVGGTSLAAPLIGAVYALANSSPTYGSLPYASTSALYDVTSGSNGSCTTSYLCNAASGYDAPTGLGTPIGLAAFTAGAPIPSFTLSASPSSNSIAQGGGTGFTVTMAPQNGFTGSASLTVSGLPSGATGAFSPTSVGTSTSLSSTLSITTVASVQPGTYPLTITGTGTVTQTASATLVVQAPAATITASPSSVGSGGTVTGTFANLASPTTTDWIGVFAVGAGNTSYLSYEYDSSCTTTPGGTAKASGSCSVKMPTAAGNYELRLMAANGFTVLATSNTITVGAAKSAPSLTTAASAGVTLGGSVSDTATLSGGSSPSGTITFSLYGPNNSTCSGTAVSTSTVTAAASARSGSFTPTAAGTYQWVAAYSGDSANNAVTDPCGASGESVVVSAASKATPSLSTTASAGITLGGTITDTAALTGGSSPSGTIMFSLYGPNNSTCTGAAVYTSTEAASGSATSSAFVPTATGTYQWVAAYSGDSANNPVTDPCGASGESVTVSAASGPTLSISTTSAPRGTKITVTWSGVPHPTTTDWIGVFTPGATNQAYLSYAYTSSCTTTPGPAAAASGSCSITIPSSPNTYQFRLLALNGFTLLATSPNFTAL